MPVGSQPGHEHVQAELEALARVARGELACQGGHVRACLLPRRARAGARIGEITLRGTLGFVVFTGIPAGLLIGALYALAGALLPPGRAGGLILGAILIVLAGSLEPLRSENFDFNLVGPDWLSVLAFTALALFQGLLVVALAARLSRGVPSVHAGPRMLLVGRVAIAAAVLVSLPFFAGDVADILQA
jgi:hypothetical protein